MQAYDAAGAAPAGWFRGHLIALVPGLACGQARDMAGIHSVLLAGGRATRRARWRALFGPASQRYAPHYRARPASRRHVQHLGEWYAQAHPTEDFAETFAVWLTPRANWRRRYRNWPALLKLKYVDSLMKSLSREEPRVTTGKLCTPVENMNMLLAEHYGQRAERFRAAAQGYVDDKLREIFPAIRGTASCTA